MDTINDISEIYSFPLDTELVDMDFVITGYLETNIALQFCAAYIGIFMFMLGLEILTYFPVRSKGNILSDVSWNFLS